MVLGDVFENTVPVTLEEMLAAREARSRRQQEMLERYGGALVSFTLNIPGEYKAYPLAKHAFDKGVAAITAQLRRAGAAVLERRDTASNAGFEACFAVDASPEKVKTLALIVENGHPLGRLFDIDVLGRDGVPLKGIDAGRSERQCFICGKPVWECSRSRAHPAEELSLRAAELFQKYFDAQYADRVASLATKALLYEVNTTPKPGLVDRNNAGSHADMTSFTFIDSSVVLTPYFRQMTHQGMTYDGEPEHLLPWLRFPGQTAEESMFLATREVNTHKGLIFSMGIVCAAMGYMRSRNVELNENALLAMCGRIAASTTEELSRAGGAAPTHGETVFKQYGLTGIRGEAADGYPHIRRYGYPAYQTMRALGCSANDAGVIALLHLIAHVPDTNMISRSSLATLETVQARIREVLEKETDSHALLAYAAELDREFIRDNLSPGGCADLLAIIFFLSFVFTEDGLRGI